MLTIIITVIMLTIIIIRRILICIAASRTSVNNCRYGININTTTAIYAVGRTGAVVSVADYGPRGPWFETWPRHGLLWP